MFVLIFSNYPYKNRQLVSERLHLASKCRKENLNWKVARKFSLTFILYNIAGEVIDMCIPLYWLLWSRGNQCLSEQINQLLMMITLYPLDSGKIINKNQSHSFHPVFYTLVMNKYSVFFIIIIIVISSHPSLHSPSVSPLPVAHGQTQPPKVSLATGIHGPIAGLFVLFQHLPKENKYT